MEGALGAGRIGRPALTFCDGITEIIESSYAKMHELMRHTSLSISSVNRLWNCLEFAWGMELAQWGYSKCDANPA